VRAPRLAGALWLALAAGCARVPPPDLSRDPAALLEQVRAAQSGVTTCRGSARLSVSSSEISGSLDAWVAAEKGGRVRVEVFDFFGNPAAVLVAGGGRFSLYDSRAGALYRGDDTPENLARLLSVPVGGRDLSAMICGSAPLIDGRAVTTEPGDGVVLLEIAGQGGRQVLAVGSGAAVERASYLPSASGGTPWKVAFSSFRHAGGQRFPEDVELRGGGAKVSLLWRDDVEVNAPPEESLFRLAPPRGARVVDLASGARPPPLDLPVHSTPSSRP
jgi:hypothetical protein